MSSNYIEFRSRPFPGPMGPLLTTPYVNMEGYKLARLGDLGKVKLTAAQKAQVTQAAQAALLQKKILKTQAGVAKAQYKTDLAAAKRAGKVALVDAKYKTKLMAQDAKQTLYAPAPLDPIAAANAANPFDYSSIVPSAYSASPGGGGGGAPNFSTPSDAPAATDTSTGLSSYLPWLIGGGAAIYLLTRK